MGKVMGHAMSLVRSLAAGLIAFAIAGAAFAARPFDALDDAKAKLASSDGRERRAAVAELARLGGDEAWKLVVGALADADAQVADEAQLQVAKLDDAGVRKHLLGKEGLDAKNALVRERVAEALGRSAARPAFEVLAAPLDDREPPVRRSAAWSIERLVRAGRFEGEWDAHMIEMSALEAALFAQAAREKDAETHAALMVAHQALLGAPRRKDLDALLASKSAPARCAAAIALRSAPPDEALALLAKLAVDPNLGVRLNCARSLAVLANKQAALALVGLLERESELRAKWLYVEHLRGLSGLAHRLDPRPWRDWAEKLADGALDKPAARPSGDDGAVSSAFAGLPILSERVAFLIDLSGSMWEKRADGRTRKQLVDEELARALRSLAPQVRFNVVVYTAKPAAWKERLTPASPKAVEEALQFFEKRKDQGKGDFWGALEFALADPEVDTLIVLSDGAPSGGQRWNLELMKALFAERTRFRGVVLEAVLADASNRLRDHWVEMCASSGGRVVEVQLR
jgi:hypothetical protein